MNLSSLLRLYKPNTAYTITAEQKLIWQDEGNEEPSKEEIESWKLTYEVDLAKQDCKVQAKRLLSDSDWSELPSVVEALENAAEWKSYRVQLRKYVVTPVQNPVFPSVPQVKWKEV